MNKKPRKKNNNASQANNLVPDEIEVIAREAHVKPEVAARVIATSWAGPLPPPHILNSYSNIKTQEKA